MKVSAKEQLIDGTSMNIYGNPLRSYKCNCEMVEQIEKFGKVHNQ